MAISLSHRLAVDIVDEKLVLLQLKAIGSAISVHQLFSHPLDQPLNKKLNCQSLMTVMEHRAVHYQQIASKPSANEVREVVAETLGVTPTGDQPMVIDHQQQLENTVVVTGHPAQVAKKKQLLALLNKPITVVEPAFQSVLRAVNFLLPEHWPTRYLKYPCQQWLVIQLAQPLAIVMNCLRGDLQSLNFSSISEVSALTQLNCPIFFFGPSDLCRTLAELVTSPLFIQLKIPAQLSTDSTSLTADKHIPLLGLALRGFNQWHH
ncbi:hypothetical protein [Idiomarina seosinensis]|uniref:Pilus assembly protein PilM n=1 Tax=Idiomarina seosinensis TaxID=281739 RepID=A0A432Z6U0_9GAMM|nr:hypothetical protein [Idiomarina seosinensis]RUO73610.1 hypothetical protein CWI81_11320 [Idiomarina seosinensis]